MPFCTTCGANVNGTFCSQCGTPVAAAGTAAPPPTPPTGQPPMAQPYAQPYAQPVTRKTSPIVWVLVIVLGFFVVCGISVALFVGYVAHRVHQAVDVNGRDGGFTFHTRGRDGKDAVVQVGGSGKVPSWVPVYPGSEGRAKFAITGAANGSEGGAFSFTTSDDPMRVKSYYEDKVKGMGMTVNMDSTSSEGGMLVAAEDSGDRRSLQIIVGGHTGDTSVQVIYGRK
jgi:hypothetical protein